MKIQNVRPIDGPANARGFRNVGRFNYRVTDDVILYDLTLVKSPMGKLLLYGPETVYHAQSMSMAPALRTAIIDEVKTLFKDQINNDRIAA